MDIQEFKEWYKQLRLSMKLTFWGTLLCWVYLILFQIYVLLFLV